ncbi:hypothetical protein ACGFNU_21050 [Spirillospora sp. NPDC048911]|uniref:hypothetical protein n=1 Tax=Spirillospora sp. NPDC048911 TaxID=3364527 RepID=UPI003712FB27
MISPEVSRLVERNATASQVAARAAANLSPCCRQPIQGVSAVRWCGQCGHTINAADIDHEVTR